MKQVNKILTSHNSSGAPQEKRAEWMTPDLRTSAEGKIGYFAGCQVAFNYGLRNLPINAIRILNKVGIEPVYLGADEWCCGGSMFYVGCTDEVMQKIEHNVKEFHRRGIKTLITSCAGCWANIFHFYNIYAPKLNLSFDIDVRHIVQEVDGFIRQGKLVPRLPAGLKVTYHDPCHIGRAGGIYQAPRDILAAIPGLQLVEMERNREHAACCGRHIMRYPRLGTEVNRSRLAEAAQTGAWAIIGTCPTCENNLRTGIGTAGYGLEVIDIMDLVAYSVGLPTLSVSKLSKLLHKKALAPPKTPKKVEKYFTEKELERENSLFAPSKMKYETLSGKACDIAQFVEPAGQTDLPRPPSSC